MVTVTEMIELGETLINCKQERTFIAHFGMTPLIVVVLWTLLLSSGDLLVFTPLQLLWTLHFLKCYQTVDVSAAFCKIDCKTWSKWVWIVIFALYQQLDLVLIMLHF